MSRYKPVTTHATVGDRFITVICDAQSHGPWGLHTFFRSQSGWYESATLILPSGKKLNRRGEGLATRELSASHELLISEDEAAEAWRTITDDERNAMIRGEVVERMRPVLARQEPGTYSKIPIRCNRCGDNLPVTFAKLNGALDLLQTLGEVWVPLGGDRDSAGRERATLRRAVNAASRR